MWDRGTTGIRFHQSKVLTPGDLFKMTGEEIACNEGHDHVFSNEVVKFLIILAEQKSDMFPRAPAVSILRTQWRRTGKTFTDVVNRKVFLFDIQSVIVVA